MNISLNKPLLSIALSITALTFLFACNNINTVDSGVNQNEITTITLATFNFNEIAVSNLVSNFNTANSNYRIEVIDYSQFNIEGSGYKYAFERFLTDIVSNNPPDILDLTSLPSTLDYIQKGLLTDLYPFIDNDPEINRSDFMPGILEASEIDGMLYEVFQDFTISTIVGSPYMLNSSVGWNIEEFANTLTENPQADMPLGKWFTPENFIQTTISLDLDKYVSKETGTTHFDSPEFFRMLETTATLFIINNNSYVSENEAVATGHQIMSFADINGFPSIQYYKSLYGGEIVYKGLPNSNRNGNIIRPRFCLAISENSLCKEAAWRVVRTILSTEFQLIENNYFYMSFPVMHDAFDKKAQDVLSVDFENVEIFDIPVENLTQADIDIIKDVIATSPVLSGRRDIAILQIINEETSLYFGGVRNIGETVDAIQERVSLVISERS